MRWMFGMLAGLASATGACEAITGASSVPRAEAGIKRSYAVQRCGTAQDSSCKYTSTSSYTEFIDSGTIILNGNRTLSLSLWHHKRRLACPPYACSDPPITDPSVRTDASGTYVLKDTLIELNWNDAANATMVLPPWLLSIDGAFPERVKSPWRGPDTLALTHPYDLVRTRVVGR